MATRELLELNVDSVAGKRVAPISVTSGPRIRSEPVFLPHEYMFLQHRIILRENLFPQSQLDREKLVTMASYVEQDYRYAPEVVKSCRMLELFTTESSHVIFVITEDVTVVTELLRAYFHPRKIVGNTSEHMWMFRSLDFVVSTTSEAETALKKCPRSSDTFDGFVVDQNSNSPEFIEKLRLMLHCFRDVFKSPAHYETFVLPMKLSPNNDARLVTDWVISELNDFQPRMSEDLLAAIKAILPEAASCPGLLDSAFSFCSDDFSIKEKITVYHTNLTHVSRDPSIFVAFMPGLLHVAMGASSTKSIIISSVDKVAALTELLQRFLVHLGLFDINIACLNDDRSTGNARIAVGTPDKVLEQLKNGGLRAEELRRTVLHNVDVMCTAGSMQEILDILKYPGNNSRVGLHSSTFSSDVEDIIKTCPGEVRKMRKAGFYMVGVRHFYDVVDDKIKKVVQIWMQWGIWTRISVVCSSVERVEMVASQLLDAGVFIVKAHTGMDKEALEEADLEFSRKRCMLVTNINYKFGRQEIVNFDVPRTPEEYVDRVEMSRGRGFKIAVNLLYKEEEPVKESIEEALGVKMLQLPPNCRKLQAQIRAWESGKEFEDY